MLNLTVEPVLLYGGGLGTVGSQESLATSLAKSVSFCFNERPYLQTSRQKMVEDDSQGPLSFTCVLTEVYSMHSCARSTYMYSILYTQTHMHIHTYIHICIHMLVNRALILCQCSCVIAFHYFLPWRLPNIERRCGFEFCLSLLPTKCLG